jgi:hypothetical protein
VPFGVQDPHTREDQALEGSQKLSLASVYPVELSFSLQLFYSQCLATLHHSPIGRNIFNFFLSPQPPRLSSVFSHPHSHTHLNLV